MADITMCPGTDCPYKESCYRYTARANEFRQSWFTQSPIKDGRCDMYWGKNAEAVWEQLKEITKTKK